MLTLVFIKFKRLVILNVHYVKNQSINKQKRAVLERCFHALALPKIKEKHCMGKVLDWDKRHFFFLYIDSSHLFTSPIHIPQRSSNHTYLMWNVANFMTDEV